MRDLKPIKDFIRRIAINMSATNYLNETIYVSHQTAANDINYCILPTLHSHTYHEDEIHLLNDVNIPDMDQKSSSNHNQLTKSQQLDPYIDAVQVKGRVNNKRGARVRAATTGSATATSVGKQRPATGDHEPVPSYYSKTVHVEEKKESHDDWDYSSGDSDDDEDDDEHHHHHHHHGKKKYHHKRGKKKHGGHYGKKKYGKAKGKGKKKVVYKVRKKPVAKVVYVKHVKHPKKGHDEKHHYDYHYHHQKDNDHHDYHKHYHYHDDKHGQYEYDKQKKVYMKEHDEHPHHYHGKSKGKLVHLDLMGKGKMSLAGVLGYTLLCVNYLLVLKQPSYDKHSGHYYTKYQPHGGHGDTVQLKSAGPVILAHCGELPEQKGLVHVASSVVSSTETANSTSPVNTTRPLQVAEQQEIPHLRDRSRLAANSPPAYYYTLAPTNRNDYHSLSNYQAGQPMTLNGDNNRNARGFLGPIQSALNRLFLLPSLANNNLDELNGDDPNSVRLVSRRPIQSELFNGNGNGNVNQRLVTMNGNVLNNQNNVVGSPQSAALINANGGRVILVNGQPQLIQTRDNLAEMRTRQVQIGLRIAEGRRFGLPQRQLSLIRPTGGNFDDIGRPLGLAVRAPSEATNFDDQIQNDQPTGANQNANQVQVDLPEYALAGDSIELTCNHRMPMNRLLSVRWFKDTLEFYRFVPADMRPKTGFFLPDVLLDLARSTAQSIFLRNVTHRTSGMYRCEVILGK